MSSPVMLFTAAPSDVRDQMLGPAAQEEARKWGYEIRLNPHATLEEQGWAELLEGVEALITTWGAPCLSAGTLARNNTLKIVGHAAGSVASIVSDELFRRGVRVVCANSIMARAVAEWSLMMSLFGWWGNLSYAQMLHRPIDWPGRKGARSLRGATVGIWGYGDIAAELVPLLKSLQPARILICSKHLGEQTARELGVQSVGLEELLAQADVIHLLAALTAQNKDRMGARELAMIRDGALLINAGRAEIVQQQALLAELRKNRFTAVLDVHYQEPLPADNPFLALPNVMLTPHCAGAPGVELYVPCVLQEFHRFFNGQPLQHEITASRAAGMTDARLRGKR